MPIRILSRSRVTLLSSAVLVAGLASLFYLQHRQSSPELRVGYTRFIPYVIDGQGGKATGLAVDVLNEAAKRTGIRLKYVDSGDDIDAALAAGKIDIFPLLTLTPKRIQTFHASQSWWDNEIALVSLETATIQGPADTNGKRIAIRGMSVVKALAQRLFPRAELVIIPKLDPMVSSLCEGKVDALFLDVRLLHRKSCRARRRA